MSSGSPGTSGNNAEALWQSVDDQAPPEQSTGDRAPTGHSIDDQRPACAACKHQRKRCDSKNCIFFPYFPGDKKEEFDAVHQVFGVIKVKKMLESCWSAAERRHKADEIKWLASMLIKPMSQGPAAQFRRLCLENQYKTAVINELQNHIQNLNRQQPNSVAFCSNCKSTSLTADGGSSHSANGITNPINASSSNNYYPHNYQISHSGQMGNQYFLPTRNFIIGDSAYTSNNASSIGASAGPQLFHGMPSNGTTVSASPQPQLFHDMPSNGTVVAALPPPSDNGSLMYR